MLDCEPGRPSSGEEGGGPATFTRIRGQGGNMLDVISRRKVRLVVPMLMLVALAACSKKEEAQPAAATPCAPPQAAALPRRQRPPLSRRRHPPPRRIPRYRPRCRRCRSEQLREAASLALRENRMYAPAGNNALRVLPGPARQAAAGRHGQERADRPDPVCADRRRAEHHAQEFPEAQRLISLIEKVDDKAPALPRLKAGSVTNGIQSAATRSAQETEKLKKQAEEKTLQQAEQKKLAEQQAKEAEAAKQIAAQQESSRQQPPPKPSARLPPGAKPNSVPPRPPRPSRRHRLPRLQRRPLCVRSARRRRVTRLRSPARRYLGRSVGGNHGRRRRFGHQFARVAGQPGAHFRPRGAQRHQALEVRAGRCAGDHAPHAVVQPGHLIHRRSAVGRGPVDRASCIWETWFPYIS